MHEKLVGVGTLDEDIDAQARWIVQALRSSGYNVDFSGPSLCEIDRFIDDHSRHGKPYKKGLLAGNTGIRLFSLGALVGEVIRRELGGMWGTDDEDPHGEIDAALILTTGGTCGQCNES